MLEPFSSSNFATPKFCASVVFLSSALACSVFRIASCHLMEAQRGRDCAQETFLLLVFYFLLEFLGDDIDFECKERSALEQACGEAESLRPAVRPESPCPSTGIGICVRPWDMPLMAGASGSDNQCEERQRPVSPPEGGRHFVSSHDFSYQTLEQHFTIF